MLFDDAKKLLPEFKILEDRHSELYDSHIRKVFITSLEGNLAETHYLEAKKNNREPGFTEMPANENSCTLAALLENGEIVSVKSLVVQGHIPELAQKAEELDYLQYNGNDITTDDKP